MNNKEHATAIASAIAAAIAAAAGVQVSTVNAAAIAAAITGPETLRPYAGEDKTGISTVANGKVVYGS